MKERLARSRPVALYILGLLLAGVCNVLCASENLLLGTVSYCLNYMVYTALLLFWIQSVRTRLLPSRAKTYILAAAMCMFLLLFLRSWKYRGTELNTTAERYGWYAYYPPFVMMVTLFCMCCLRFSRLSGGGPRFDERLLLLPAGALSLAVLTNDLHHQAFRMLPEIQSVSGNGAYSRGPVYWAVFAWAGLCVGSGVLALIAAAGRRRDWRRVLFPLLLLGAIPCLAALQEIMQEWGLRFLFHLPEIEVFCVLGAFEYCIRGRLMAHNENYAGFFAAMETPAVITDRDFAPVYRTAAPLAAAPGDLPAALRRSVYPNADRRLSGMAIRAGYAFWEEDEGELRRMNERLQEANETLSLENELIRHENEMRERRARVESRNRIYGRVAEELYPTQERLAALLAGAAPGTDGFRRAIAVCSVMNAFVKRRSNLLLTEAADSRELILALEESVRYLKYCGVEAAVLGRARREYTTGEMCALYDTFEALVEAFLPHIARLTVSLTDEGLRLMLDARETPLLPPTPLPVEIMRAEDCLFCTVRAGREGAA